MTLENQVHNLELRMLKAEKEIKELQNYQKQQLLELQEENNRREIIDEISNNINSDCPPY